jgi:hypothetical protein
MNRRQFVTRSLAAAAGAVLYRHPSYSYAAAPLSADQIPDSGEEPQPEESAFLQFLATDSAFGNRSPKHEGSGSLPPFRRRSS